MHYSKLCSWYWAGGLGGKLLRLAVVGRNLLSGSTSHQYPPLQGLPSRQGQPLLKKRRGSPEVEEFKCRVKFSFSPPPRVPGRDGTSQGTNLCFPGGGFPSNQYAITPPSVVCDGIDACLHGLLHSSGSRLTWSGKCRGHSERRHARRRG